MIESFICCSRTEYGEKCSLEDKVVFPRSPEIISAVPPITHEDLDLSHRPSKMEILEKTWCGGEETKLVYRYWRATPTITDMTFAEL